MSKTSSKKLSEAITGLIMVGAGIWAYNHFSAANPPAPAIQQAAAQPAPVAIPIPRLEQQIIDIVADYAGKYDSAPNQMAQGILRHQRAKAICKALTALDNSPDPTHISNWVGTVTTLSSNGDGSGVLEVALSSQLTLGTWNNDLSDLNTNSMIPAGSPLMATAAALTTGQSVYFSGKLYQNPTDCLLEMSVTLDGTMQNPEFVFRFSDIRPAI